MAQNTKIDLFCYTQTFIDTVKKTCREHRTDIVLGIDPGVDNCALWMGLVDTSCTGNIRCLRDIQFLCLAWMHVKCTVKKSHTESAALVLEALRPYAAGLFSCATRVRIEEQHPRNARMQHVAKALFGLFGGAPRVKFSKAYSKFNSIVWLPCPMPKSKIERKRAAILATENMLSVESAGGNDNATEALRFYMEHGKKRDDLSDAELLAKDAILQDTATLLSLCASDEVFAQVAREFCGRRAANKCRGRFTATGRKKRAKWSSERSFPALGHTFADMERNFLGLNDMAVHSSSSDVVQTENKRKRRASAVIEEPHASLFY